MPRTVLFLHSSAGRYGADLQLVSIASGLDRTRFTPIAVLPERGELGALLEREGVEVTIHPLAVLRRGLASPAGLLRLRRAARRDADEVGRLAREGGAAIVHSNTSVVLSGQDVARAADARHVMHVREIYEGAGPRALWPFLRRRLLRADAVVCISRAVAAQFGASSSAEVVYDGLPRVPAVADRAGARAALGVPPDRFAVALIGRVSDWKGQDVLARALAEPELADVAAVGLVAGDAFPGNERYERELKDLRDRLELGDRMRLLGFQDDLANVLGAADAVAIPSTRPEPLGLVALEAGAAGLPVVASAHGGVAEVVRDGETGRLVAPGDHRALAAALRGLADDPASARRIGDAAAADIPSRFGRERMLEQVQAAYDRVLTES